METIRILTNVIIFLDLIILFVYFITSRTYEIKKKKLVLQGLFIQLERATTQDDYDYTINEIKKKLGFEHNPTLFVSHRPKARPANLGTE